MTWVTNSLRAQALKSREQAINYKLLQISQRLIDLSSYGAAIGDGRISDFEASSMPATLQQRTVNFMGNTYAAMDRAQANYNGYLGYDGVSGLRGAMGNDYNYQANGSMTQEEYDQMTYNVYQNFLSTELQEYGKQEAEKVHVEEKKIEQEKLQLETQLKAIQAEYEGVSKAVDNDIKNSAIKLA